MSKPSRTAVLYRMVMPDHTCPWGLKARHLLKSRGYTVDDRWLTTREETDAFKAEHGVKTTPQVFIDGQRIGGHDDLRRFLGLKVRDPKATTYTPVLVVFLTTAVMAAMLSLVVFGTPLTVQAAEWFIALSMMIEGLALRRRFRTKQLFFLHFEFFGSQNPFICKSL